MPGAIGATTQREMGTPLEQAIQDRFREVAIMHHPTQGRQRFVRREQNRPPLQVPFVNHSIQHIGGIRGVREIPELVDDEDVGMQIRRERRGEPRLRGRAGGAPRSIRRRRPTEHAVEIMHRCGGRTRPAPMGAFRRRRRHETASEAWASRAARPTTYSAPMSR